jgi:dipeptidyl aminopeptidase/acylaminoacyl peptidase
VTVGQPAAFGGWSSPIDAALLVQGAARIDEVIVDGAWIYWGEGRPTEQGRTAIMRRPLDDANFAAALDGTLDDAAVSAAEPHEVTPPGTDVRTRVHEYGGGAWWVEAGVLLYVDAAQQRVWRLDVDQPAGPPLALTPAVAAPASFRYADLRFTPDRQWVVAVRERHVPTDSEPHREPVNELVAIAADGSGRIERLAAGADFYAAPRPSADGHQIAWLQWNHPNMPWDATELWVARLANGNASDARTVAGQAGTEALVQPEWTADGRLLVVSDRDEWWNLYRVDLDPAVKATATDPLTLEFGGEFEIGLPLWNLGQARYDLLADGRLVCAAARPSGDVLLVDDGTSSHVVRLPYSSITMVRAVDDHRVAAVVASYALEPHVVVIDVDSAAIETVCPPRDLGLDDAYFAPPRPITFGTVAVGRPRPGAPEPVSHALLYAPAHPDHPTHVPVPPPEDGYPDDDPSTRPEAPPLLVLVHGGPTSAARRQCSLALRYWTSRGFAVVDVDYRGSTGYGRTFRRALDGQWGRADVLDVVAATEHLVARGYADPDRVAIRGGSAGGFTVLAALTFHDTFTAGASLYGIADLEALAQDTHKFESRYLDRLVGPYPEARSVYVERSPIHHLDRLVTPLLILQGLDDAVVPPNQAEMMADGLRDRGVPHAYMAFAGEGHGFRKAETIMAAIQAELAFYAAIWGFTPGDPVPPIDLVIS